MRRRHSRRGSRRGTDIGLGVLGVLLAFGVCEAVPRAGLVRRTYLPPASDVLARAVELAGDSAFLDGVAATVRCWALGLGLACAIAVPTGLLLGSVPVVDAAVRAIVEFLRPMPSVALIPLVSLLLGSGAETEIALVTYASVWPILYNTMYGLGESDPLAKDTLRAFGFGRLSVLLRVELAGAAPFIAAGIRISASVALIVAVATELLSGFGQGLGIHIAQSQLATNGTRDVLAGVVWAGALGLVINGLLVRAEAALFPWTPERRGRTGSRVVFARAGRGAGSSWRSAGERPPRQAADASASTRPPRTTARTVEGAQVREAEAALADTGAGREATGSPPEPQTGPQPTDTTADAPAANTRAGRRATRPPAERRTRPEPADTTTHAPATDTHAGQRTTTPPADSRTRPQPADTTTHDPATDTHTGQRTTTSPADNRTRPQPADTTTHDPATDTHAGQRTTGPPPVAGQAGPEPTDTSLGDSRPVWGAASVPGDGRPGRSALGRWDSGSAVFRAVGGPLGARSAVRTGRALLRWTVLLLAVGVWEVAARARGSVFFPPPSRIARHAYALWFSGPARHLFLTGDALGTIGPSLGRMAAGFSVAAAVGGVLGVVVGRSRRAYALCDPVLQFARAVPPPALVPVFVVVLDFGTPMQVASIVFSAVWPVLINTAEGARNTDPLRMEVAAVLRLTPVERLRFVIVPSALPRVFAGLRLSLSLALILMVFSELLPGTENGIGFTLTDAQSRSDLPTVWAALALLGVLGYLLNSGLLAIERRLLTPGRTA
ncbi:ABC transporter permease subunit [Streptomyces sp. NPDC046939]|uniref:ABC transporter permease subunit n=1 Tax=Streptomyces sp. NPDC046939 TaxID=3155376 RepID=UPI0033FCC3DA